MAKTILTDEKTVEVYHNIDSALKVYRHVSAKIIEAPQSLAIELSVPFGDFDTMIEKLDIVSTFRKSDGISLESRLRTLVKSRLLINKINGALGRLKTAPGGELLYNILCDTYINIPAMTVNEIAEKYNIGRTSYFRYRDTGKEYLVKYLWKEDNEMLDVVNEIVDECGLQWVLEE